MIKKNIVLAIFLFVLTSHVIHGATRPHWLDLRHTPIIDIRSYGGSTSAADNLPAINNAIQAGVALGIKTILIPEGEWKIKPAPGVSINLASGVSLLGMGKDKSILLIDLATTTSHHAILCSDVTNVNISKLGLRTTRTTGTLGATSMIRVNNATGTVISDVLFDNAYGDAIYLGGALPGPTDTLIENIRVVKAARCGINCIAATNVRILSSEFSDITEVLSANGIDLENDDGGIIEDINISNCSFYKCAGGGINIPVAESAIGLTRQIRIVGNTFEFCNWCAIYGHDFKNAVITNNLIRNCGSYLGSGFSGLTATSFAPIHIISRHQPGVSNILIADNILTDNYAVVSGIFLQASSQFPSYVGSFNQITVANNIITGNGLFRGIAYNSSMSTGVQKQINIHNNNIDNVTTGISIVGNPANIPTRFNITNNNISLLASEAILLNLVTSSVVSDNNIIDVQNGILLASTSYSIVGSNRIASSSNDGIYLTADSSFNAIHNNLITCASYAISINLPSCMKNSVRSNVYDSTDGGTLFFDSGTNTATGTENIQL